MEQDSDYVLASTNASDVPPSPEQAPGAEGTQASVASPPVVPDPTPGAEGTQASVASPPVVPAPTPEPAPVSAEQRRLDTAFAAQRRRLEAVEAENQRLRQAQQPRPDTPPGPPPRDPNAPRREWFQGDDEAYMQALAAYNAQRQMTGYVQREAWNRQLSQWETQETQVRQAHPDYDSAVDALDVQFHPGLLQTIHQHPQGPELSYYLAQHPEEAARIAHLPPTQGLWELGRLVAGLEGGSGPPPDRPPDRATPPAQPLPTPPQPVGPSNGSTSTVPMDEMEPDEFAAAWVKRFGTRW